MLIIRRATSSLIVHIANLKTVADHVSIATDLKYLRFGREIKALGQSLKQLGEVADNARRDRITGPSTSDARVGEEDVYRTLLQPMADMTGDFQETLDDCKKLLSNQSRFRRNAANFVDNVIWHTTVERDVLSLTGRLQHHANKVIYLLKPLEL